MVVVYGWQGVPAAAVEACLCAWRFLIGGKHTIIVELWPRLLPTGWGRVEILYIRHQRYWAHPRVRVASWLLLGVVKNRTELCKTRPKTDGPSLHANDSPTAHG
ncbi:MAG: hypothetical protein EAY75_18160 [Bacteroidetes bacterium]|nr:MAG: hypothetical protein EAY75_18160 [Bacteroidota bacterium]